MLASLDIKDAVLQVPQEKVVAQLSCMTLLMWCCAIFRDRLKRRIVKLKDGLLVVPGTTVEKVLACFEKYFGSAKLQKTPCDAGIQQEDMSKELGPYEGGCYRSIIGLLLYLSRDRIDIMFTVKELATSMSKPTLCSLQRLRRLMGYLRHTGDMGMKLPVPEFGKGKRKEGCECEWILETFTDADWSSNKAHRKSTSCAVHFMNGCFAFASSRTQKVISLSDSGKILWIQQCVFDGEVVMGQVPTLLNFSDIGTKCLPRARLNFLLHEVGAMDPTTHEMVGQEEHAMVMEQSRSKEAVCKLVKFVKRMSLVLGVQGLESFGAEAVDAETCKISNEVNEGDDGWWMIWIFLLMLLVLWVGSAIAVYKVWRKLETDLQHCCAQLADQDGFAADQEKHIYEQTVKLEAQDVIKDLQDSFEETFAHLSDRINETSNELSMLHDYTTGLHYSLVEHGGFLRNGMGLSREQWSHLNVLERANLISSRTMGSVEYMRLVRQHVTPVIEADDTDGVENDEPMTEVPELPPQAEMEPG